MWPLLNTIFLIVAASVTTILKIAVIVITVALCAIVVKRIWKGKTPSATTKEEEQK